MKRALIFCLIIMGFMFSTNCYKEPIIPDPQYEKVISLDIEKFDSKAFMESLPAGARDGGQNGFNAPASGVTYNPFTGFNYTVANLRLVDSVKYVKTSDVNANAWDIYWDLYNITYHFKNGSTLVLGRTYAPESLGDFATYIPNVIYNQLDPGNNKNFVAFSRINKKERYTDFGCGVEKFRFYYSIKIENDSTRVSTINSKNCVTDAFITQFIIPI
ncbi:MAG: hypothetical protein WAT79_08320 [Saprospiraceae bacterium]